MHLPPLIVDLATILGIAALTSLIFKLIRLPITLGYLVAGIIIGPHTPPSPLVTDIPNIKTLGDLGVIFLMFTLGLEFSFHKLARIGSEAATTALFEIGFQIFLGLSVFGILKSKFGLTTKDVILISLMISISSTTIILKTFEELKVSSLRFAELVFGILIVEDLIAILVLAVLSTFVSDSAFALADLSRATLKLFAIIGIWFISGYFLIPRLIKKAATSESSEILTVVCTGFCLGLAALSSFFHYSPALGAFIMGSIIAESSESEHIEKLMKPLRDVFTAVFFVSVGMLIDPAAVLSNLKLIALISSLVVFGKILGVFWGATLSGHSIRTAMLSGFSLAQIGEYSFIIAGVGLSLSALSPKLYSTIVAVSVITTFFTPFLIRFILKFSSTIAKWIPKPLHKLHNSYSAFLERRSIQQLLKPEIRKKLMSLPAILSGRQKEERKQKNRFQSLAPWDGHLVQMKVHPNSKYSGLRIEEAALRNRFGLNIVAISRGSDTIIAPKPSMQIFPNDQLLVLGTDEQILKVQDTIEKAQAKTKDEEISSYQLRRLLISDSCSLVGKSIRNSNLREKFSAMVVGIERGGQRMMNPDSDLEISSNDVLWLVADNDKFLEIENL